MIAVDTNVIVRFLTHDDDIQYSKAYKLFEHNEVFISDSVILETEWVLRFAYQFTPEQICAAFSKLFGLPNVHLSNARLIAQVISWHLQGMDFADALHLANSQRHKKFYTFDKKFINAAKEIGECTVLSP